MKNKVILESLISLFSIRTMDYVMRFALFPFLTHILGVERYGAINFARSYFTYFSLAITYSFSLTAPRDISMAKSEEEQARIFSAIVGCKVLLFLGLSIVYFIIVFLVDSFYEEINLFTAVYVALIGEVIFPSWFFQGIEKMRYITYAMMLARCITIGLIFLLVRSPQDAVLAAFLQSSANIMAGLYTLYVLCINYSYLFRIPLWQDVLEQFKGGFRIFYSQIFVNLYTSSNVFFLGIFTNNTVVGYFSAANSMMQAMKSIVDTISAAIYPHTSKLLLSSKAEMESFLALWLKRLFVVGLTLSIFGVLGAANIVIFVAGQQFQSSVYIFQILALIPVIVTFTNIYLIQTMILMNQVSTYSRIVTMSALINLLVLFPLMHFLQGIGVAISMVITELYVAVTSIFLIEKNGTSYLPWNR